VEADAWWIERLYRHSSMMAPATGDSTPSSSCWREPSPASSVPSLPAAELDFWPPANPFPTHGGCYEQSTKLQLPSSWTPTSTMASSGQSSQWLRSSCGAEGHYARPLEDSLSSEFLARQRRPLGCGLGSSICPRTTRSSILASSLSLSFCDETGGLASADEEVSAVMRAIAHDPAPTSVLQPSGNHSDGLMGVSEHSLWQRTVAQMRRPYSRSSVPLPHFPT